MSERELRTCYSGATLRFSIGLTSRQTGSGLVHRHLVFHMVWLRLAKVKALSYPLRSL